MRRNRIFSTDSAKAEKAEAYGHLNAICYLAPADTADGTFDLCPNRSPVCTKLCLGLYSGHAAIVSDLEHGTNPTRQSRRDKAVRFMRDRTGFLLDMVREIDLLRARAKREGLRLCVRLNGSSDIAYEGIRFIVERNVRGRATRIYLAARGRELKLGDQICKNIFDHYPMLQFVDYTKIRTRFERDLPKNYRLTFSRSETNDADCLQMLSRGHNVAVVFAGTRPRSWHDYRVINGDKHDLRHLDPRARTGRGGYVIGLSPKGRRALTDTEGFVVR